MAAPTTMFEDTGGASFTTLANERAFLEAIAADPATGGRMRLETLGHSTNDGFPMWGVYLGAPAPATLAEVTPQKCILFLGSQHGNEAAGREACLTFIRDLAYTTDPDILAALSGRTVIVIPNASPNGSHVLERMTYGMDLNRQNLTLGAVENRIYRKVIRDAQPTIVVDLHELAGNDQGKPHFQSLVSTTSTSAHPALVATSNALIETIFTLYDPATEAAIWYPNPVADLEAMRQAVGLDGRVAILSETDRLDPPLSRVMMNRRYMDFLVTYAATNAASLEVTVAAARLWATQQSGQPRWIGGQTVRPTGYRVTAEQFAVLDGERDLIDLWQMQWQPIAGSDDVVFPMAQVASRVIPTLMDPLSSTAVVQAERLIGALPDPPGEPAPTPDPVLRGNGGIPIGAAVVGHQRTTGMINVDGVQITLWRM